jgi:hypothetical protein
MGLGVKLHFAQTYQRGGEMKTSRKLLAAFLLILCAFFGGRYLVTHWFFSPPAIRTCFDESGYVHFDNGDARYLGCVKERAKLFLENDYAESKDLSKTFLTLISALLVASITFSEKIVDVHNAEITSLSLMIICWALLLVAIVACGTGLAYMTTAAGIAAYAPTLDYRVFSTRGVLLFLTSGVTFVFALLSLIGAGIVSLVEKRSTNVFPLSQPTSVDDSV